jgi:hypothetical protein
VRRTALVVALLAAPAVVAAQDAAPARRALIERAAVARDRGDHALALTLAREAAALGTSPSLRAFIAHEHVALGQHQEAVAEAEACAREAEAPPRRPDREALLVECRTLASSQRSLVRAAPVAPATAAATSEPSPVLAPPAHASYGPWIVGGVGAASLALTVLFAGLRADALSSRDALCVGRAPCSLATPGDVDAARGAQDRAADFSTGVNVTLAVGGAALVGAVTWYLLDRSAARRVAPTVTYDGRGAAVGLGGVF